MKINKFKINNTYTVQVYLSKDEANDNNIKIKIDELKKQYKNVGIFISGENDFKNIAQNVLVSFQNSINLG